MHECSRTTTYTHTAHQHDSVQQSLSTKARALVKESKELKSRIKAADEALAEKEGIENALRETVEALKSDIDQLRGEREALAAARDAGALEGAAAARATATLEDSIRAKDAELVRVSDELAALRQGKANMELRLAELQRGSLSLEQEKRDLQGQLDALKSETKQLQVYDKSFSSCDSL